MGKSTKNFALGAIVAGAVGYVAGILTAPKSGKETRQDIQDSAQKARSEAEKQLKSLQSELSSVITKSQKQAEQLKSIAKSDLVGAIDKADAVKQKARELLSAVRNGEADDKDLQKVIDDVKKSIDHLSKFLKKDV